MAAGRDVRLTDVSTPDPFLTAGRVRRFGPVVDSWVL